MAGIKGTSVSLLIKTKYGENPLGEVVYEERWEQVDDVLIGEPTSEDSVAEMNITGKRIAYVLGIPKDDTHMWHDTLVSFFGETFRTIGYPIQGIEENVPTRWHKKVKVERYG